MAPDGAHPDGVHRSREAVNGTDESFNGKFRTEYLSLQWFRNRLDAKVGIEQWRRHYNDVRPHMSLGNLTPAEFKATLCGQFHGGALAGSAGSRLTMEEPKRRPEHESPITGALLS